MTHTQADLDRIISALACGQSRCRCSSHYLTHCPVPGHADRHPSFHPSLDNGKLLVHCLVGCSQEAVVQALKDRGLWPHDNNQWPPDKPQRKAPRDTSLQPIAEYVYADEAGTSVAVHGRFEPPGKDKFFLWRLPDGTYEKGLADLRMADVPLWGLPELVAKSREELVVFCFSADTEILTPGGWTNFSDLTEGMLVAQYDLQSGQINFIVPMFYQRFDYEGSLVHIKSNWCDLAVTPDHRIATCFKGHPPVIINAARVKRGRQLPVAGYINGFGGPSVEKVRLVAAFQADGGIDKGGRYVWNLKKGRKKERLRKLLLDNRLEWMEKSFLSCPEWTQFYVTGIEWVQSFLDGGQWPWECLGWSLDTRKAILDELGYWDGDFSGNPGSSRFFTAGEQNANVISALAAVTGHSCILRVDHRRRKPTHNDTYILNITSRNWRRLSRTPCLIPYDGKVFCCTVPSGFIVVRRNGKTTIAGNCEGEKATLACRDHGLTAHCLGGGSSQKDFGETLKPLEGRHIALWPDNDEPGRIYMARVRVALRGIAAEVLEFSPPVPPKGDAFEFFRDGGTLETLMASVPPSEPVVEVKDSETFHVTLPGAIRFEFTGTEQVRRAVETDMRVFMRDKMVYWQRLNLLSASQRTEARRELDGIAGKDYGWAGLLSDSFDLVRKALAGQSSSLRVARVPDPGEQQWLIPKFLPAGVPSLWFGEEGTTKSFLALMAGLCVVLGETFLGCKAKSGGVLYVDYEDTAEEFARRVRQMYQGLYSDATPGAPLPDIPFIRRDPGGRAFWDLADDIRREVAGEGLSLVIVDCVDGAVLGDLKESSAANRYFAALDRIGVTSLSNAHITKVAAEIKSDRHKPFGVTQWNAKPRRTWFVAKADSVGSVVDVGMYCRKVNTGEIPSPVGCRWTFGKDAIRLGKVDIREMGSLQERRALQWQIWDVLTSGMLPSEIADAVECERSSVVTILRREKGLFVVQANPNKGREENRWFRRERNQEMDQPEHDIY